MNPGKLLVVAGLMIAAIGALMWLGQSMRWFRLFRLPGDIAIERDGFSLYIPITSLILLSVLATGIYWLVGLFKK